MVTTEVLPTPVLFLLVVSQTETTLVVDC